MQPSAYNPLLAAEWDLERSCYLLRKVEILLFLCQLQLQDFSLGSDLHLRG